MPTTIPIPGGHAVIADELTVGGRIAIQVVFSRMDKESATAVMAVQESQDPDGMTALSDAQLTALLLMPAASVLAFLQSWTLPDPVPQTVTEVRAMRADVFDAIEAVTRTRMGAATRALSGEGWTIDAIEDPTSPTVASAVSNGSSAVAVRRPSDRKKPVVSRSGSTRRKSNPE